MEPALCAQNSNANTIIMIQKTKILAYVMAKDRWFNLFSWFTPPKHLREVIRRRIRYNLEDEREHRTGTQSN